MPHIERSGSALLLAYHSINDCSEDRIRVPSIVTPRAFEAQIRYLAAAYRVMALPDYIDHINEGRPLPARTAVVTIDDGYKDNLVIASPILRKYGMPATFFVITDCIGAQKMKWEDELSCMIRRSNAEAVSLTLPSGVAQIRIGSGKRRFRAVDLLVGILGHLKPIERSLILDGLREQTKVKCDDQLDVMLTWDDVRQLADTPGFSIGSHSVTHQHLCRIPSADVTFEVTSSKERLQHELGRPVTLYAYPYGEWDRAVATAVQSAGYSGAVTLEYGWNGMRSDPFCLKRVLAPNRIGLRFSAGIRLRASMFGEYLRRSYNAFCGLSRTGFISKISTKAGTVTPCGS